MVVSASDTVNSSEPLDNAHRVPMNVIVDEVVAVLQVLTFGNTVGCNQNIKLIGTSGQEYSFALRNRREAGQHRVEIGSELRNGCSSVNRSGNLCRFQSEVLFCEFTDVCKEVIGGIRECSEDNDLLITGIDWLLNFLADQVKQRLQLCVMLRRDVGNHEGQEFQILRILFQLAHP